ncbi:MAG: ABC transporter permease [Verrucomicrobiales bacterium]|nr:ABC transporter permease [Verrucomicrobiales bacterium]
MILDLLLKDLKRTRHNPWPVLIFLAVPLCITGLLGAVFGSLDASEGLGRIRLAVVDEDESALGGFLRSAFSQGEAGEHFEPLIVERDEGERLLRENEVSAMLVIPSGFTTDFLAGAEPSPFELVKNPAQAFHPAIVEELMGVAVEGLSAVAALLGDQLPGWRSLFEDAERLDYIRLSSLILQGGERLERVEDFLFPPLVGYESTTSESAKPAPPTVNLFAYLLPGMAAMFLLFIGDGLTRDLYKEVRMRTLDRYRTMRISLLPLLLAKMLHAFAVMLVGALILFGGASLIFGFAWREPLRLAALVAAYVLCAAGCMTLLAALARSEKRADAMNTMIVFAMAFTGGSMFPLNVLPAFIQRTLSPVMPNYWLIRGAHQLEQGGPDGLVIAVTAGLAVAGVGLVVAAAWRFDRLLRKGVRE